MIGHLKIVIFEGSSNPPIFIKRLAEGLAEKGHKIWLLHFHGHKNSDVKNLIYFSLGGKNEFELIFRSSLLSAKKDKKSLIKTFKFIYKRKREKLHKQNLELFLKDVEPDLIHVQWPSLLTILENVLEKQEVPVILSQRGYQINIKPFANKVYLERLREVFLNLAGFHSVSLSISAKGNIIFNLPTKKNKVVYTGVDLIQLPFQKNYKKGAKLKIISLGRPHWIKSYHDSIRACAILKAKNIDFEYLIIGGKGNEELLFLLHTLGLEGNINIIDKLPQKEVFELMQKSDILLLSSIEEGLPNVLVEAMALGTPVLSTSCGGVEELIEDGRTGWLTPIRNPEDMADRLEAFYLLPVTTINTIRKAAREKVERQHSKELMIENMEKFYSWVLNKERV